MFPRQVLGYTSSSPAYQPAFLIIENGQQPGTAAITVRSEGELHTSKMELPPEDIDSLIASLQEIRRRHPS